MVAKEPAGVDALLNVISQTGRLSMLEDSISSRFREIFARFDTISAEGQRRYVTLSPYVRQFLDQMERSEGGLIDRNRNLRLPACSLLLRVRPSSADCG